MTENRPLQFQTRPLGMETGQYLPGVLAEIGHPRNQKPATCACSQFVLISRARDSGEWSGSWRAA